MRGNLRALGLLKELRYPVRKLGAPATRPAGVVYPSAPLDDSQLNGKRINQVCPDTATTNIKLELAASVWKITVDYWMKRSTYFESGILEIMLNTSHASPEIASMRHRPAGQALTAIGVSFTADVSSSFVRLNVVVDASSANDVTFLAGYTFIGV